MSPKGAKGRSAVASRANQQRVAVWAGAPESAPLIEMEWARARLATGLVSLTLAAVSEAVQTNLELARQAYELGNASGVDALRERFWAPDIVFYDLPEA